MESSKIFGAEECQSSESGWTMYIGSPISDQEDDDDDDGHNNDHKKNVYHDDDEYMYDGSDDSMASDASSGPSHLHQQTWEGNGESGHGHAMVHKHHKEDKVKKQVKKKKKKTGFEARKETKEEYLVTQKRGIVTVQSGNKARYIGQRK